MYVTHRLAIRTRSSASPASIISLMRSFTSDREVRCEPIDQDVIFLDERTLDREDMIDGFKDGTYSTKANT